MDANQGGKGEGLTLLTSYNLLVILVWGQVAAGDRLDGFCRDIREMRKLDTVGAYGTTIDKHPFRLAPGEARIKMLVGLVPEDKTFVLKSSNFLRTIQNVATAVEAGAEEAKEVLVLPLPVKNWPGRR